MEQYLATFHTHLSAMLTCQALQGSAVAARMTPVPRALSSSCGICVRYEAADPCRGLLDEDLEAVYEDRGGVYAQLFSCDGG